MLKQPDKASIEQAGFTLVEMLTAVFIVAILLAVGAPGFNTFIQNMQIRTTAEAMQAGLNLARNEAVKRNARVSLWMVDRISGPCVRSATGAAWVVSVDDPTGKCSMQSSDTDAPRLIQSRSVSDGSTNVGISASGGTPPVASSCVTFNGFGRVELLCDSVVPVDRIVFASTVSPNATRAVGLRVVGGGAIRMCDPAVTVSTDSAFC
ncbi:MAG: pilus assembly protein FimT [Herminiimonas sp.]|nr:pilus assembly protein FimT [Herminiimonas sp.]